VSVPGGEESTAATFEIGYEPDGGDLWVVNNGLMDVEEGGSKVVILYLSESNPHDTIMLWKYTGRHSFSTLPGHQQSLHNLFMSPRCSADPPSAYLSLQDFLGLPGPLLPTFGNHDNA